MIIELREWEPADNLELAAPTVHALAQSQAFNVSPDRGAAGRWRLTAQQFVGVATIGSIQIRVLPKIPVYRLVELLCESIELVDWRPEDTEWAKSADPLVTITASFIEHTERALELGLIQGYATAEDDLHTVRGRIDFGRMAGRPTELPLAVTFDEYTTNVIENQLLAGAGRVLRQFSSLPTALMARLRRLEYRLLDVTPTSPSPDPPVVTWSRLNERYRWAATLARLILRSAALDFDGPRGVRGASFLIDMNRLFEIIVGRGIERAFAAHGVRTQLQAADRLDDERRLTIRPDILASKNGLPIAVADLKYKSITDSTIASSDVYQALAYARRYGLHSSGLIYPNPPPYRNLDISGTRVTLHHINLNRNAVEREEMFKQVVINLLRAPQPTQAHAVSVERRPLL